MCRKVLRGWKELIFLLILHTPLRAAILVNVTSTWCALESTFDQLEWSTCSSYSHMDWVCLRKYFDHFISWNNQLKWAFDIFIVHWASQFISRLIFLRLLVLILQHSRKRSSDESSSSDSSSESSSSDEERESRRSKSKRTKKERKYKSKRKRSSSSEEAADGPLPLSRFFGNPKSWLLQQLVFC